MKDWLYFAADLAHIILALVPQRTPPASLWFKLQGQGSALQAGWLLSPANYARVYWQCRGLERLYAEGKYPLAKIVIIREKLKPITDFAFANFGLKAIEDCWDWLENHGGPQGKLAPPDPLPPSPFDSLAAGSQTARRWNAEKCRFESLPAPISV
jgi:hypothetical protein